MASRKIDFSLAVRATATTLAQVLDQIDALAGIYVASGYQANGSDPITNEDLIGHDISVEQLAEFAVLAVNLKKFVSNDNTAMVADYESQLDAFRNI